jgi:predicted ribosome quality control (RQC) complex YloA/Tae2 family protein
MTKFREHLTESGSLIFAGKNAANNEELVAQVEPTEDVFHTDEVGSPFVNIKGKPKRGAIKQAAIFCAAYSKDWKQNQGEVIIHHFKGKDISKNKTMKLGTFGVRKLKKIKVKKSEILNFLSSLEEERV